MVSSVENIGEMAALLVGMLQEKGLTFAAAESCTGGAVSAAVTSVPGCSSVMLGGVVAYDNRIKQDVLGVDGSVLRLHGAVSEPVVRLMVEGVAALLRANCAVATSGIAGPGGGTPEKPVGTVWIAAKVGRRVKTKMLAMHDLGREENVKRSVREAISMVCGMICAQQE